MQGNEIGNPPFGKIKEKNILKEYKKHGISITNNLFTLFLNKSLSLSKNVAFVLPKSLISSPEHDQIRSKIEKYQKLILDENFWKDQSNAQKILKEKKKLDDLVSSLESSIKECKELDEFFILATEENNSKLIQEITKNIANNARRVAVRQISTTSISISRS